MKTHLLASTSVALSLIVLLPCGQAAPVPEPRELKEVAVLRGHREVIWRVAFSPDSQTLASGTREGTILLWDLANRKNSATLKAADASVNSLAFSPDGKVLAAGSFRGPIRLWDVIAGRAIATLTGHRSGVRSLAFSPDGKTLASGGTDSTVRLWDVGQRKERTVLKTDGITWVAYTPEGKALVVSLSIRGPLSLWDVAGGKKTATLEREHAVDCCLALSPDGKTLVSGDSYGDLLLWDVAAGKQLRSSNYPEYVIGLDFRPDGKILAVSCRDHKDLKLLQVRFTDFRTGKEVASRKFRVPSAPSGFSPDGKTLVVVENEIIKLWDVRGLKPADR